MLNNHFFKIYIILIFVKHFKSFSLLGKCNSLNILRFHGNNFKIDCNNNDIPKNINKININNINRNLLLTSSVLSSVLINIVSNKPSFAASTELFKDNDNKFTIYVPPGWTILPRKIPSVSFSKYQSEEILLVASNFAEAVSFSVSKTDARRLLKDFNIDWWFSELSSLSDVGNAELLSKLLTLQRQNNFEGAPSATELVKSNIDNDILYFEFYTPVVQGVKRESLAKAYFDKGYLYVVWISGLKQIFDGDYGTVLQEILESFKSIR